MTRAAKPISDRVAPELNGPAIGRHIPLLAPCTNTVTLGSAGLEQHGQDLWGT